VACVDLRVVVLALCFFFHFVLILLCIEFWFGLLFFLRYSFYSWVLYDVYVQFQCFTVRYIAWLPQGTSSTRDDDPAAAVKEAEQTLRRGFGRWMVNRLHQMDNLCRGGVDLNSTVTMTLLLPFFVVSLLSGRALGGAGADAGGASYPS